MISYKFTLINKNANILFIYIENSNFNRKFDKFKDNHFRNATTAIGISSGGVALAAAQMGYKTGFCQCFMSKEIKQELIKKGLEPSSIHLLLGKPNTDHKWCEVLDDDRKLIKSVDVITKSIKVFTV